jgi:hypothetical protein
MQFFQPYASGSRKWTHQSGREREAERVVRVGDGEQSFSRDGTGEGAEKGFQLAVWQTRASSAAPMRRARNSRIPPRYSRMVRPESTH